MKEYFSYSVENTENLPCILPHPVMIYVKNEEENPPADLLTLGENSYLDGEEELEVTSSVKLVVGVR